MTGKKTIREKGYKFRLYPNKKQKILINKSVGCSRYVYNHFLAKAKEDKYKRYTEYSKQLTKLKRQLVWLKEPDKFALQNALKDLDKAFNNFFSANMTFLSLSLKRILKILIGLISLLEKVELPILK